MLGLLLFLALWGLIVGSLARLALPGPDPMSIWMTILIGVAGSFIGGLLAGLLWRHAAGIVFSVLVSTGLVYLYRRHTRQQGLSAARRL